MQKTYSEQHTLRTPKLTERLQKKLGDITNKAQMASLEFSGKPSD